MERSGRGLIKGTILTASRTITPRRITNTNTRTTATLVQCVCGDSVDCVVTCMNCSEEVGNEVNKNCQNRENTQGLTDVARFVEFS
jgi:hypothetical protein